jgi:hypothetical protein
MSKNGLNILRQTPLRDRSKPNGFSKTSQRLNGPPIGTKMTGNSDESILRLWERTSSLSVEVQSVEWDSFSEFNSSFLKVAREAAEIALLTEATRSCWRIRRTLLSTPLQPSHFSEAFRNISTQCHLFVEVASGHRASPLISGLEQSCDALAESENPMTTELENISSRFNRTALLLAEESLREPVQNLLDNYELDGITVLSVKQLRSFDMPPLDALICIGNPQQTFLRSFATSKADSQRTGWLITSPPATNIFIVATNFSPRVDLNNLWLLDGSRPAIEFVEKSENPTSAIEHDLSVEENVVEISHTPWSATGTEHRVTCVRVEFQSQRFAFFPESKLGSPRVIDINESDRIEIIRVSAQNLVRGMVLLLQGSRSETEQIRERAVQMLRLSGDKESQIDEVLLFVTKVKQRMSEVLAAHGRAWLEARLAESGLARIIHQSA